jgi:hypothetical protein
MKPRIKPPIPPRRIEQLVSIELTPARRRELLSAPYCGLCEKLAQPTQATARTYLAFLISRRSAAPDDYLMRAYACPHGNGWHVGHNRKVSVVLRKARKRGKR